MAIESYYARAFRRAWQDTKAFFGWNKKSLVFPALYLAGLFFYWQWQGVESVREEIAVFIAFGLAPMGVFAIVLFIWNSIMAPSRIEKEAGDEHREEVDGLKAELQESKQRLQDLEEERIPRVVVKPNGGRRHWDWEHEHLMWSELQVTNTSSSLSLNDVEVRLINRIHVLEKQDAPGNYMLYDPHDWSPLSVYWSERNAPADQLKMTIPPSVTRTALIAFSDNSNGPPAVFNATIIRRPLLHSGGAKIEIEVSSPDSAPWRGAFYIECHPNYLGGAQATFEFVAWETWATNYSVTNSLADDKEHFEIK